MPREHWIRCRVRPGVFTREYIISIDVAGNGHHAVEFVSDADGVKVAPNGSYPHEGQVRVWSFDDLGQDPMTVILPASGGSDCMKVPVHRSLVIA